MLVAPNACPCVVVGGRPSGVNVCHFDRAAEAAEHLIVVAGTVGRGDGSDGSLDVQRPQHQVAGLMQEPGVMGRRAVG
jgi:hypothetical protein